MSRITKEVLQNRLNHLNQRTALKQYRLSWAYGGVRLCDSETNNDVFNSGYTTNRELYSLINAFLVGLDLGRGL